MADHDNNGGGGEVVDQTRDEGASMEPAIEDQAAAVEAAGTGAVATGGGDGKQDQQQEVGGGEGSPVVGGSSGDAGGSGAVGDDLGPIESPPRDLASGKRVVVAEEETMEIAYREEDVLFRPATTSSSHRPITKYDVAEHLPDEALAKLLEDNPIIGEIVLKAKEGQARAIAATEAAERAERERAEQEDLARDMEAEERAEAEAQLPRVTAVAEAGKLTRPDFSAEAYVPPTPHMFAPSGFVAHLPQRTEYDDEVVLRNPKAHIVNTWSKVISGKPPL
ncbi:hypothetical protein RHMOL_Rhmol11G0051800 [Rhododendron molle]|uniref:Uncharacterized protein n=1 Tax=Rhododendron molle TaxID=49168 RepID=A0ACC0LNZ5_RHOML|nr:hypothetical protein RHMOL_Rhmol11G0051800 [Rhododendron molle]